MSENTPWAKRCRFSALANIFSVILLVFVWIKALTGLMESNGEISTSMVVGFETKYHFAFLFVAMITLLMGKRVSVKVQQIFFGLNSIMAIFVTIKALQFWASLPLLG